MKYKHIKVIRNEAFCFLCGTLLKSESVHDFVSCRCGNLSIDGGLEYLKRAYMVATVRNGLPTFLDLSQSEEVEVEYS
jgi:hypothetical protein